MSLLEVDAMREHDRALNFPEPQEDEATISVGDVHGGILCLPAYSEEGQIIYVELDGQCTHQVTLMLSPELTTAPALG